MIRGSKVFAMLLFVVFCLGSKEVKAQREIHPWEPEFDLEYATQFIMYYGVLEEKFHTHYNQFYSKYCKRKKITLIHIKELSTCNNKGKILEVYTYKNGYLDCSYKIFINDSKENDTFILSQYFYNDKKNRIDVIKTNKEGLKLNRNKSSYVYDKKLKLIQSIDSNAYGVSRYSYYYNKNNLISSITFNQIDTFVNLKYSPHVKRQENWIKDFKVNPCDEFINNNVKAFKSIQEPIKIDSTTTVTAYSESDYKVKTVSYSNNVIYSYAHEDRARGFSRLTKNFDLIIQMLVKNELEYNQYNEIANVNEHLVKYYSYLYLNVKKENSKQNIHINNFSKNIQLQGECDAQYSNDCKFTRNSKFQISNYEYLIF